MDFRYMVLCAFLLCLYLWKKSLAVSVHMAPREEEHGFIGMRTTSVTHIQVPDKGELRGLPKESSELMQDEQTVKDNGYSGLKINAVHEEHYFGHRTTGIRKLRVLAADENSQAEQKVKLEKDHKLKPATISLEEKLPSQNDLLDNTTNPREMSPDVLGSPPPPPPQPSPPPPPGEAEKRVPTTTNTTKENESSPDKEESDTNPKISSTSSETKPKAIDCGGSYCEDPKKLVSACLRIPGDGALELSLLITYDGDTTVMVKVVAPEFLVADRSEISISRGKSETIRFTIDSKPTPDLMESEAVGNKMINITTIHGDCLLPVPLEYLRSSMDLPKPQHSPLISLLTPMVLVYLLVFFLVLALVGAWLCHKFCRKKRPGDAVKYQQLEMTVPGQITPKERAEEGTDGWDEVWDDDWEDTEAAKTSSRLSQNLSSRGLAGRRGNKDGWDNSWDD